MPFVLLISMLIYDRALLSSCSENCKCGGTCLNSPFQHRPVKKMKLVQVCVNVACTIYADHSCSLT